jgi:hypothetical protein
MSSEVIDTNVLTIASAPFAQWVHPRIPLADLRLVQKVLNWVRAFREDSDRHLVMDHGRSILDEYESRGNMPEFLHYGRQVVHHKMTTNSTAWVTLEYRDNGSEKVACLPPEVEALIHDLGDCKMIAAASCADAPIVNACDSDWTNENEQRALDLMGVSVTQILTADERAQCRERT